MKFTFIFMFLTALHITANVRSQSAVITVNMNEAKLGDIIRLIEEQSYYKIFYKNDQVDLEHKIPISFKTATVSQLLTEALKGTNIGYTVMDKVIVLAPVSDNLIKQQLVITGKVTSSDGTPLPGVNIVEKGTTNGAVTGIDGKYTITVLNPDAVLVFSYVGYLTEEVTVGNKEVINMLLVEDIQSLEEVVVVGYGTVKKSDITGSLSSVTAEQIMSLPVQNVNQAIQGRAAGVDVYSTNMRPGEAPTMRVRGNRSIKASNEPFYVIDGIPTTFGINELNPLDIESVEILKDASAAAIYGSRAANGVVLITTKRGEKGRIIIDYDGSIGFDRILREVNMMNGGEFAELRREASRNVMANPYKYDYPEPDEDYKIFWRDRDSSPWESIKMGYEWEDEAQTIVRRDETGKPIYDPSKVRTYNWMQHALRTGINQNHQLSVRGGGENYGIMFSAGYLNQQGVVKSQDYERINTRLNLDFEPTKWFKIGSSTGFSMANQNYGTDLYGKALRQLPFAVPYDAEGNIIQYPGGDDLIKNPIRDEELIKDQRRISRYFGSYYAEISFLKSLKYRINVGIDYKHWRRGEYQAALSSDRDGSSDYANYDQDQNFNWVVENLLYYNKTIGKHSFGLTLMQSASATRWERSWINAQNLPFESQLWYNIGTTREGNPNSFGSGYRRTQIMSYMGRLNYSLMDKYLFTATLRRDGASVFHPNNRWDNFPSFAFAWKANQESFLNNIEAISQLKLRVGYGTTGQSATPPYETKGSIAQTIYDFGGTPARGFRNELAETKEVGWEKTISLNFGVDFGFFRNRISGTIDIYRNNTYDLLLDRATPSPTGFDKVRANIGKSRNEGFEITLNTINLNTPGGFKWATDFMFSKNKEKILELYGDKQDDIGNRWFIGYPVNIYYDYEKVGIWQLGEKDSIEMALYNSKGGNFRPGDIKIADQNHDTIINEEDKVVLGSALPKWVAGITNSFSYKGFELSFFIYFRIGQGIYNRALAPTLAGRYTERDVNYWTPTNPTNEYPRPDRFLQFPEYGESLWYTEASFVKVRNITLAYNLPKSLLSKVKINNMNIYVQAINPFIFTKYPLVDPEVQGSYRSSTDVNPNTFDPIAPLNNISTKSIVFGVRMSL